MRDLVYLGPCPPDEPAVQVGEEGYEERALEECKRYIEVIRRKLGTEPDGAKLKVRWEGHDLGRYVEVVCYFDDRFPAAFDYAMRCESEGPQTWEDS